MTADNRVRLVVRPKGPFDLPLCLRATASFSREPPPDPPVLRFAARIAGRPSAVEAEQSSKRPVTVEVRCRTNAADENIRKTAEWVLSADLDLRPFYQVAHEHPSLGPIVRRLRGLKPFRTASVFEMAVTAITEQQISLAAAHSIRKRIIERFGDPVDGIWCFPSPERLAAAGQDELLACGLSRRKAEYAGNLARLVSSGKLDLEATKRMTDDEAFELITSIRGFGSWSANYMLIRGLGRPDRIPYDDLGVRTVVGRYIGNGSRMEPTEVEQALAPLTPFRGLATFYVIVHHRLSRG